VQISEKVQMTPWKCLDKRSERKACTVGCLYGMLGSGHTEKGVTSEGLSHVHAHFTFYIKGIIHEEFILAD
jgi:hypothetical protein